MALNVLSLHNPMSFLGCFYHLKLFSTASEISIFTLRCGEVPKENVLAFALGAKKKNVPKLLAPGKQILDVDFFF